MAKFEKDEMLKKWLLETNVWKKLPKCLAVAFVVFNTKQTSKCKHRHAVPWFEGGYGKCMASGCTYVADPVTTKRLDRAHVRILFGSGDDGGGTGEPFNHIVLLCRAHNLSPEFIQLDSERAHVFALTKCLCGVLWCV